MNDRLILSRRTLLGAGLVGAIGIVGAACSMPGTGGSPSATRAASLQLSWLHSVQFGGSYIALDRGWWQESGLEVDLLQGGPNAPVEPPRRVA